MMLYGTYTGLSLVKMLSNASVSRAWGWSPGVLRTRRSKTLTTLTRRFGASFFKIWAACRTSAVVSLPIPTKTTSGSSPPWVESVLKVSYFKLNLEYQSMMLTLNRGDVSIVSFFCIGFWLHTWGQTEAPAMQCLSASSGESQLGLGDCAEKKDISKLKRWLFDNLIIKRTFEPTIKLTYPFDLKQCAMQEIAQLESGGR